MINNVADAHDQRQSWLSIGVFVSDRRSQRQNFAFLINNVADAHDQRQSWLSIGVFVSDRRSQR
ncbi:hypothetical protein [Bacillus niameyensis]|uniref:hypothetical protein n=1 Tax=Bacillus niameyensis TaxID=1522308 RepID=UPI001E5BD13E|nr:hypothetical protein [Bacillus niameyensis]